VRVIVVIQVMKLCEKFSAPKSRGFAVFKKKNVVNIVCVVL